jgi:hypothetical protein
LDSNHRSATQTKETIFKTELENSPGIACTHRCDFAIPFAPFRNFSCAHCRNRTNDIEHSQLYRVGDWADPVTRRWVSHNRHERVECAQLSALTINATTSADNTTTAQ